MKIQVQKLSSSPSYLEQTITVEKKLIIDSIRPRLYFHNDPIGTFTISILQGATILSSKSLTMAQIILGAGWTVGQYHHGLLRFQFDNSLVLNPADYKIKLSSNGYTSSASSYLGWIRSHEDQINNISGIVYSTADNPLEFEMWGFK